MTLENYEYKFTYVCMSVLKEEKKLRIFDKKVIRRIYGLKRRKETGEFYEEN
jgi:hypothetical protein